MNIRPMEMQVLIPKATEVSKVQQNDTYKGTLQQQEFAAELQKNMLERQRQVQHTSESEGRRVDKDKEKEQKHSRQDDDEDKDKGKKEKRGGRSIDPLRRGSILDINT